MSEINKNGKELIAKASITIQSPISEVWDALVSPTLIKQYMFGTDVVSDWKIGSPIVWKGVWKNKPYEDKGIILKIEPMNLLQFSHFSPLSGDTDIPENYHTLTYELSKEHNDTLVSLSQDNNKTEEAQAHSLKMWKSLLIELKKVLEKK